jgi:Sulfotransferase family
MDAAASMDTAQTQTGLENYGPEADAMVEALSVLVRSANEEADLDEPGAAVFTGMIVSLLVRRLEVERWYAGRPEIGDQEIGSVLFGVGLPRTGSTALSYLLAQDGAVRSLRMWEASQPTPPPELDGEADDPRFLAAKEAMAGLGSVPEEITSMLPSSPDGPSECLELLNLSFRCSMLDTVAQTPSYGAWLMDCDYGPAYRYHERVLKLLQWHRPPNRWRLKTPAHMFGIDALDAVYPDAKFVITHRDPAKVMASLASVETAVVRMYTGKADPLYFGRHCVDDWDRALRRFLAFRDRVGEDRFFDIAFTDMQRDPVGTVRGLYEWLGEDLTPETAAAMQAWWDGSQDDRSAGGGHHYTPEEFGLDADALHQRFAYYSERFPFAT